MADFDTTYWPAQTLVDLYELWQLGLVTLWQTTSPVSQLDELQSVPPDTIPQHIQEEFANFQAQAVLLKYEDRLPRLEQPLAISVRITLGGDQEWGKRQYRPYWDYALVESLTEPVTIHPLFARGCFFLYSVILIIGLLGYSDSSWSYGGDTRVDLSQCLSPIVQALKDANAPYDIIWRVKLAAFPNTFSSQALELLDSVYEKLSVLSDNPQMKAISDKLGASLKDMNYFHGPTCSQP